MSSPEEQLPVLPLPLGEGGGEGSQEDRATQAPPQRTSRPGGHVGPPLQAHSALGTRHSEPRPHSVLSASHAQGLRVAYFAGCMTDRLYPEMGEAVIRVLRACGVSVDFPAGQSCCGLPALNSGDRPDAVTMARQTIAALEEVPGDYILSGSASCVVTMTQDYAHLFRDDPKWGPRAARLAARVIDFTSFMERVVRLPAGALAGPAPGPAVTYHDACQSHNCLGLRAEPRRLLTEVLGLELREMTEPSFCCGFGGSFSLEHPDVSARILGRKLRDAQGTGAAVLVADNPGCLLHLRGGVEANRLPVRVLHLAEVVAARLNDLDS